MNSVPEEIDEADRRVRQLEIERAAIKREKDSKKLDNITQQIANAKEKLDSPFNFTCRKIFSNHIDKRLSKSGYLMNNILCWYSLPDEKAIFPDMKFNKFKK